MRGRDVVCHTNRLPLRAVSHVSRWIARAAVPLLALALAAFVWADNAINRGVTFGPDAPAVPRAGGPQLGVNLYNIQFEPDPAVVTRTLALARAMGASHVRLQMPWDDVEIHARGDFEDRRNEPPRDAWAKYDWIIAETTRLGLQPIVRVDRAPAWSRPRGDAEPAYQAGRAENGNSTGPPDDYADFARFMGAAAARYQGRVRYWQLWNEPNLAYEWGWRLPEPERFVTLLAAAAQAVRTADPQARVLFPSLSPTDGLEPRIAPMTELEYLERVYAAGGAAYFDIMSAQAYGLGQPPDEHRYVRPRPLWRRPIDTRIDVSRVVLLREVMERNGDAATPVWIGEFGYVADAPTIPPERRRTWGEPVAEDLRAAYTVGQLERARREWPWIGVMNVWFLRWGGYQEPDPQDPTQYFALVSRDWAPLPTYNALRDWAATPATAGPGAHSWSHPAVAAQGAGAWQIRFDGNALSLASPVPATVTIDGGAPLRVEPGAALVLVASSLADGTHTALVQAAQPPTTFGVAVDHAPRWLWEAGALLLIGAMALAGALAFAPRRRL